MFGYEDKTLEIMHKELHYVSVKDFNRFMSNGIKYHGKNQSCWYWLQCFSTCKSVREKYKKYPIINYTKSVPLPQFII